jgi:hypothetical protein
MRVLVAGRNAKVLAKAAGTFANDLEIHTAATKAACLTLRGWVEFDLIVACETLSDGSGLEVSSHVAVNTPNTLRVFAARPATLTLLKGELGLFGLFRTLPYPINLRKLWAAISLARQACVDEVAAPRPAVGMLFWTSRRPVQSQRLRQLGWSPRRRGGSRQRERARRSHPECGQRPATLRPTRLSLPGRRRQREFPRAPLSNARAPNATHGVSNL